MDTKIVGVDKFGHLRVVGRINVKGDNNTVVVPSEAVNDVVVEGDNNTIIVKDNNADVSVVTEASVDVESDAKAEESYELTEEEKIAYRDYMYVRYIGSYRKRLKAEEIRRKTLAYKINKLIGIEGR